MKAILSILLLSMALRVPAALNFDGVNTMVKTPVNLYEGMAFSFSMWVNVTGNHESAVGVIMERRTGGATGWAVYFQNNEDLSIQLPFSGGTAFRSSPTGMVVRGRWAHVAVTTDNLPTITGTRLYFNGVESTYPSGASTTGTPALPGSFANSIGNRQDASLTFNGQICEVAFWTNQLTQAEVSVLATRRVGMPLMVRPSVLRFYYPMNNGPDGASATIGSVVDWSGRNEHGVPTSSPTLRGSPFSYP